MSTPPPFALTQEQSNRLLHYIQRYRRHLLTQLAPSTGRNTNQRVLQAFQGKLLQESERRSQGAMLSVPLTSEEIVALKTMISDLFVLVARETETDQRHATLGDLAALKSALEKLPLHGPPKQYTQTLF